MNGELLEVIHKVERVIRPTKREVKADPKLNTILVSYPNGKVLIPGRDNIMAVIPFPSQPDGLTYRISRKEYVTKGEKAAKPTDAQNFPDYPSEPNEEEQCPIMKKVLENAVRVTVEDELRPIFNTVLVKATPKRTTVVATDSYRLFCSTQKGGTGKKGFEILVPSQLLKHAIGLFEENIHVSKNNGLAVINGLVETKIQPMEVWLSAKLFKDRFPKYKMLIPKNNPAYRKYKIKESEWKKFCDTLSGINSVKGEGSPLRATVTSTDDGVFLGVTIDGITIAYDGKTPEGKNPVTAFFDPFFLALTKDMGEGEFRYQYSKRVGGTLLLSTGTGPDNLDQPRKGNGNPIWVKGDIGGYLLMPTRITS